MTDGRCTLELVGVAGGPPPTWPIRGRVVIGRHEACEVVLSVDGVSRRHAEVADDPAGPTIRDLGSRNGTFVGGRRVGEEPVRVVDGDRIVLGGAVELRLRDPLATPFVPAVGRLRGLWLDPDRADVWIDGRVLDPPLTTPQLDLLRLLDAADGAVVDRVRIVDTVWGAAASEGVTDDAVTKLVQRVRVRLAELEGDHAHVEVVRGRGVRLRQPGD